MAQSDYQFKIRNKRIYPRYEYRVGIAIKSFDPDAKDWENGVSQNVSQDGIYLLHSRLLVPGEKVYIRIKLFPREEEITVSGTVSWVGFDELYEDSPFWVKAGIAFHEMNTKDRLNLIEAISDRKIADGLSVLKISNKIDFVM